LLGHRPQTRIAGAASFHERREAVVDRLTDFDAGRIARRGRLVANLSRRPPTFATNASIGDAISASMVSRLVSSEKALPSLFDVVVRLPFGGQRRRAGHRAEQEVSN